MRRQEDLAGLITVTDLLRVNTIFARTKTLIMRHFRMHSTPVPDRRADPATRRAALWLVMQVIRLAPTPRPTHALHLGYTAQDDFFGRRRHSGWAWLATQAREWPTPYRTHFWAGFEGR